MVNHFTTLSRHAPDLGRVCWRVGVAFVSRWFLVGSGIVSGVFLTACSTPDLRGRTQSVAGTPIYDHPSYAGRHGRVTRASRPARAQANIQYYPERHAPAERRPENAYEAETAAPVRERSYALAPPVERHPIRDVEWRGDARSTRLADAFGQRETTYARAPAPPTAGATSPESHEAAYQRRGWAGWIGKSWRGHRTTSGEMFDADRLTGAHDSFPIPSFAYVTNRRNGRTVLIRVNDRVPYAQGRAVIVSRRVAELLDFRADGRADVDLQYAGPAAPVVSDTHEKAFLGKQRWYRPGMVRDTRPPPLRAAAPERSGRYPVPSYPRWDNTRR